MDLQISATRSASAKLEMNCIESALGAPDCLQGPKEELFLLNL